MESEHGSTPTGVLRMYPPSTANVFDLSTTEKKLRSSSSKSSSSSPDTPFDNPFKDNDNEHKAYKSKDEQLTHELPVSTLPPQVAGDIHQLNFLGMAKTESPPFQVMERSGDPTPRIPSCVFARTKSTAPVDWSVASNESLFSIHTGNMNFNYDAMFWQSGELGVPGEPSTSSQIKSTIDVGKPSNEGNAVKAAVETMKEVKRKSAKDKSDEKFSLTPSISVRSDVSGTSGQSFAFPILIGDTGREGSVRRSGPLMAAPDSFQTQTQPPPQCQSQPQPLLQPESQPQVQQPQQQEPQTKRDSSSKPPIIWTSWLRCSMCCFSHS